MNDIPSVPSAGTWTAALAEDELWEGDMTGVTVDGVGVLLMNVDGQVRAYRNRCPHQDWALDEGELEAGTLVCSRHLWEFDALSGRGINPDDCALTAFPVKVEDRTIWVSVA